MKEQLLEKYGERKDEIRDRLEEFTVPDDEEELFQELCFCLFVPQSRAKPAWEAVRQLHEDGTLYRGDAGEIAERIRGTVRFHNQKAERLVAARELFLEDGELDMRDKMEELDNPEELREWLVDNLDGMGYKLASQFLRNTGICKSFAILDTHVLKNLERYGVAERPATLTPKRYMELEDGMREFSEEIGIPMAELDLLFWSEETGEVFK